MCYYESSQGQNWQSWYHQLYGFEIKYLASSLVSNPTCKQEPLTLIELRKLKLFLGAVKSLPFGSARNEMKPLRVSLWFLCKYHHWNRQWNDNPRPTLQLFTKGSILSAAWLKYVLYWKSKYSQDPLSRLRYFQNTSWMSCHLFFFCHPDTHSCKYIFIKHRLINHSFRKMLGIYQRELKAQNQEEWKINYQKSFLLVFIKKFTKSSMPVPNYFTSYSVF